MMIEPRAMREIHAIRERIYEETKYMTPEEYNARVRERSKALLDRYGIALQRVECPVSGTFSKII
jgi:hypothetical protein